MTRRTIFTLSALFLLLTATIATAQLTLITTIAPAHHAIVDNPFIEFSWHPTGAFLYQFTLKSIDGQQSVTRLLTPADICDDACAFLFFPDEYGWLFREGMEYQWQVKGKDSSDQVTAKSPKRSFTADMLTGVSLNEPLDDAYIEYLTGTGVTFNLDFEWKEEGYTSFRLKIWKKNGKLYHDSGWSLANCVGLFCTLSADFVSPRASIREYQWQIFARNIYVMGKAKSEKRSFTIEAIGTP